MKNPEIGIVEVDIEKNRKNGFDRMDAITYGVRARFEESTGYIKKITDTTISVAKALGVPEKEINKWVKSRLSQTSSEMGKLREIKSILEKNYGSSLGLST